MKIKRANKVFVFWALMRSGHHAIADWVRYQFSYPSLFFNKVTPRKLITEACDRYWIDDRIIHKWRDPYNTEFQNVIALSYESQTIDAQSHDMILSGLGSIVESYGELRVMLVLRDPFNGLASLARTGWADLIGNFPGLWKNHAHEFLEHSRFLHCKVPIDYNRWFRELEYRRSLFDRIQGETFIPVYEKVSGHGGGSSFDRLHFQNAATQMKVLDRWRSAESHPVFRKLLADAEVESLCRELYSREFLAEIYGREGAEIGK